MVYLNRGFAFNARCSAWTKCDPNCTRCTNKLETTLHVFWECTAVVPLWSQLISWCKAHISNKEDYSSINCLLKGFDMPLLNIVMTLCKYHIFLARFVTTDYSFSTLLKRIATYRARDLNAYKHLHYLNFTKMLIVWKPLLNKL